MKKTNLYAYDDILFTDIHGDKDPDYIYANPTIYDIESNYKVVVNEEGSQLELIDSSNGLLKSIYVSTDMELIRHIENILEIYIKNKEHEAKAKAFDEIFKLYIGYEDGWIHFPRGSKSFNKEIINVCKSYESGEYDVKK